MTLCEIDLRVGGDFHHVFVTPDGMECSFRGTYVEIEPPTRVVNTWLFEGWTDAWATEAHASERGRRRDDADVDIGVPRQGGRRQHAQGT